jgi:hypothetical protein
VLAAGAPTIRAPAGRLGAAPTAVTPAEADPAATAPAEAGRVSAITAAQEDASAANLVDGRMERFSG